MTKDDLGQEINNKIRTRPPVVVVLGHVDHGKTKLLDAIRKTNVAERESGGITQHIGAYQAEVTTDDEKQEIRKITFLDTPGHEAFTAIRSRGAKVADVAILVVAADEGVKPQTKEAIKIIKEEKIPFVVAINKIDKEGANIQKVKQDLAAEDVLVEDWGGKIPVIEISAKQGKNIDDLLELVLLVAELEDLKEDLSLPAQGVIIESHLDKNRGHVATALLKTGALRTGDWIVAGTAIGKIKIMEDFTGKVLTQAVPSQPVSILGWLSAPAIGKEFGSASSKNEAVAIAAKNTDLTPLFQFFKGSLPSSGGSKKVLDIVLKSDVSSSLEAIEAALGAIRSEEVACRVLHYDIGNITESDVKTALGSKAGVIGFRVSIENSATKLAEKEGIKIVTFDIIYDLIEHVRSGMAGLLEPEIRRTLVGKIRVLALFKKDAKFQIIGGKVTSGKVTRGNVIDVMRNNVKIKESKITQLQHNKEDVNEVREGLECGLRIDLGKDSQDIKEGDILEIYEEEKIARTL